MPGLPRRCCARVGQAIASFALVVSATEIIMISVAADPGRALHAQTSRPFRSVWRCPGPGDANRWGHSIFWSSGKPGLLPLSVGREDRPLRPVAWVAIGPPTNRLFSTMKTSPIPTPETLLTTEGFAASDDLKDRATQKAEKLFRHRQPPLIRVRVHIARTVPHGQAARFAVRALAERQGPDCVVHAEAAEPVPAVMEALDKLERILTGGARARKHTKHHPHDIDVPSTLPKV
jgi:ribosome-associated translation inhibitor RaiA